MKIRLSHFFSDVKLPISVLCEEKFYREYEAGIVSEFLLDAMFSLSARFFQPQILGLMVKDPGRVSSYFSRKARAELDLISGSNGNVSLAEVTAAYLLAYHDFTNIPSRKAAEDCSKAVRMAYAAGLHQIDNTSFTPQATDPTSQLQLEEKRCLWWGIFMLDTFSSLTSFVPANIEDLSIGSCLPTTVIGQTISQHVFYPRRACLDDDLDTFWSIVRHQQPATARTQAVLIYVTAMAREVTAARRLCLENPRYNLTRRLNALRKKWEMLLSTLPVWFFDPTRHTSENTGDGHRKRLETLIMIHT
ncbi:hypothetical protein N7490_001859 [Penicillium lividum]|nr:hypothetical protein N7490_001859 [Penicillium lividum]